jgi:hypothetical protein
MNRLNKEAHVVEELNGVKCSVIEKNVSADRAEFLKNLLEFNGHEVVVAEAPPPKAPPKPAPKPAPEGSTTPAPEAEPPKPEPPPGPKLYNVGVTNILFHPMLAVYQRALKTPEGKIVSIAYWNQEPDPGTWYWNLRKKP